MLEVGHVLELIPCGQQVEIIARAMIERQAKQYSMGCDGHHVELISKTNKKSQRKFLV